MQDAISDVHLLCNAPHWEMMTVVIHQGTYTSRVCTECTETEALHDGMTSLLWSQ